MKDPLESIDFYNACQSYRIAPMTDQARVVRKYEELKEVIAEITKYKEMYKALKYLMEKGFDIDEFGSKSKELIEIEALIKEMGS